VPALEHALSLARLRVAVFPCAQTKAPLIARGFHAATTDEATIRRWWRRWPDALIGVPTGAAFVVLDLDLQHEQAQEWLYANQSHIPKTRMHETRSGGVHILFRPHAAVGCTTSRICRGVDTRGNGGYIIWWPAEVLEVIAPRVLAPVPDWILDALKSKEAGPAAPRAYSFLPHQTRGRVMRRLEGLVRTVACAPEGQRNASLFWASCRIAEFVDANLISRTIAVDLLIEAAASAGLPHQESRRTILSAFKGFRT
jgi:hypothetical protein